MSDSDEKRVAGDGGGRGQVREGGRGWGRVRG